jgi:hypothetical protein
MVANDAEPQSVAGDDHSLANAILTGTLQPDLGAYRAIDAALRMKAPDRMVHAAALYLAHETGRDLGLRRSYARSWVPALVELIDRGHLEAAGAAAPQLHEAYPQIPMFEYMTLLFEQVPAPVIDRRDVFRDDPSSDVQIVESPGADLAILAFCGARHTLALSLNLMDRWLAPLGAHVVYLRDWQKVGYIAGITSLGSDMPAAISGLRSITRDLGADRLVCVGNSAGASGALRYAPRLRAERVVALSPITGGKRFAAKIAPEAHEDGLPMWGDLVRLYRRDLGVRVRILYGAQNDGDQQQSVRMAGLPNVTVEAIPGWDSHHLMEGLVRAQRLHRVLGWLVAEDDDLDFDIVRPPRRRAAGAARPGQAKNRAGDRAAVAPLRRRAPGRGPRT